MQDNERWTHDFWCEYIVTDFVIAAFTVALVVVTGGLM
jgi:hypothetical protein